MLNYKKLYLACQGNPGNRKTSFVEMKNITKDYLLGETVVRVLNVSRINSSHI